MELSKKIQACHPRVLVIGAGGIGCELLKTLVLSGFKDLEVVSFFCTFPFIFHSSTFLRLFLSHHFISLPTHLLPCNIKVDLDTIDVSNLNRQFLFNKSHIGKSKAEVACEVVKRFAPDLKIKAHHANIKNPEFGIEFYRKFNLVINGLDNLDARKHVNRVCFAAKVPLIESGTEGYLGQMTVINPVSLLLAALLLIAKIVRTANDIFRESRNATNASLLHSRSNLQYALSAASQRLSYTASTGQERCLSIFPQNRQHTY